LRRTIASFPPVRVLRVLPASVLACGLLFAGPLALAETGKANDTETTTTKRSTKVVKHQGGDSTKSGDSRPADVAADNTGTNKRDRDDRAVTADQQKNDKSDVELTAAIRRAVVDDKTLSTNAHNVKIIVQDGRVTLKGPVASKAEKATIEKKAAEVVGPAKGRVTSEIEIAP
jgi:hyperosmotically inducible protein